MMLDKISNVEIDNYKIPNQTTLDAIAEIE